MVSIQSSIKCCILKITLRIFRYHKETLVFIPLLLFWEGNYRHRKFNLYFKKTIFSITSIRTINHLYFIFLKCSRIRRIRNCFWNCSLKVIYLPNIITHYFPHVLKMKLLVFRLDDTQKACSMCIILVFVPKIFMRINCKVFLPK